MFTEPNLEEGFPKGYGITEELTAADNLIEAQVVDLAFRDQIHDGHTSAKEVTLRGHNLSMTGDPNVKVKDGRPPATIDAGKIKLQFENNASLKNANLIAREKDIKARINGKLTLEQVRMTAQRDIELIAHELKLDKSSVAALKNINLEATETDITILASTLKALEDLNIKAARDVKAESIAKRQGDSNNYADKLLQTILKAGQTLKVKAEQDIKLKGILNESRTGTKFKAERHMIDEAIALVKQTYFKDGSGYSRTKITHQEVSKHLSNGNFQSKAKGVQVLYAHIIEALNILVEGDQGVEMRDVHDTYEHESQKVKKGDNYFQKDERENNQVYQATSKGARYKAIGNIGIKSSLGSIGVTNINFEAEQTTIEALRSATFHAGENYYASVHSSSESDLLMQSQEMRKEEHKTYGQNQIQGKIKVIANEVNVEKVAHQAIEWLNRIELHKASHINFNFKEEYHKIEEHSVTAPTAALSAVIALAAGAATAGVGSTWDAALGGALAGKGTVAAMVIQGMTIGAMTSLSSQAAIALVSCNGDFGKAVQSLANSKTFQTIAISALTAGVTRGLAHHFGISMNPLEATGAIDHLQREALKAGVQMSFELAKGQKLSEALSLGLRYTVAGTIGGILANQIGTAYDNDAIDPATHKLLHAGLGAATGAIISEDIEKGVLAGAIGAASAELFAEMIDTKSMAKNVLKKAEAQGINPNDKNALSQIAYDELKGILSLPVLGAAITNLLSGQEVDTGIFTATNSVENNSKVKIIAGILKAIGKPMWNGGKKVIDKSKNILSKFKQAPHPRLPENMPKGNWQPPKEALDKVPEYLGRGELTNKGQGIKWTDSEKGKIVIRMQKGNSSAGHPSQQVDYVKVVKNGKVIGRNGQEVKATKEFPNPKYNPDSHIPLSEWIKMKD